MVLQQSFRLTVSLEAINRRLFCPLRDAAMITPWLNCLLDKSKEISLIDLTALCYS
jgi:hypothetical protein